MRLRQDFAEWMTTFCRLFAWVKARSGSVLRAFIRCTVVPECNGPGSPGDQNRSVLDGFSRTLRDRDPQFTQATKTIIYTYDTVS